jgi:DnaJ-class molecular chaperone
VRYGHKAAPRAPRTRLMRGDPLTQTQHPGTPGPAGAQVYRKCPVCLGSRTVAWGDHSIHRCNHCHGHGVVGTKSST